MVMFSSYMLNYQRVNMVGPYLFHVVHQVLERNLNLDGYNLRCLKVTTAIDPVTKAIPNNLINRVKHNQYMSLGIFQR